MYEIVLAKFEQNIGLRDRLLAAGDAELVEGNYWHDNYWGQRSCPRCINAIRFNQLGKTLMRVRTELSGAPYNEQWNANYIGIQKERRGITGQPTIVRKSIRYEKSEVTLTNFTLENGTLTGLLNLLVAIISRLLYTL